MTDSRLAQVWLWAHQNARNSDAWLDLERLGKLIRDDEFKRR